MYHICLIYHEIIWREIFLDFIYTNKECIYANVSYTEKY